MWRNLVARPAPVVARMADGAVEARVRTVLDRLLREPLSHPKVIDYEMIAHIMAATSSADYMVQRMMAARNLVRREALLEFALNQCTVEGLVMEFGVFRGDSLREIARRVKQDVHGFDSFEGLPEDWTYFQKQGRFSLDGQVPNFSEPNVRVRRGWFDQTLPGFLAEHAGPARFVHIDCDLYTSTRTVLEMLAPRIVSGSVLLFDEYLNYPGWREHEYKAFQEFARANDVRYHYIGFASSDCGVAVVVD
jgi:Macrocin-O-methyltransferase (TylF)